MKRRDFLKGTASLAAGLAPAVGRGSGARAASGCPNILFIMADDHTSQAWGCYGLRLSPFARTANIDRIAREGALLRNCFCTNSICVPSRATILTGQYSHVNGATTLGGHLDPAADNLAKRLRNVGYQTAVVGKWHLKKEPAGFDYYNVLNGQGRYHDPVLFEKGRDRAGGGRVHRGHSTDVIADVCLDWLRNGRDSDRPFAMFCHFKAIHEPFYGPERYRDLYAGQQLPEPEDLLWPESPRGTRIPGWPLEILTGRYRNRPKRYPPPPLEVDSDDPEVVRRATYQKLAADYLRGVAGLDDGVGRLLAFLDGAGLAEDTVLIYTSDQGYFLGEHNLFDKRLMLEESLRMPFVIRYPREISPGTELDDIVLNVDFAELLLDYAGVEIPESMQGRSCRPNLRGRTPDDWRDAMYYHYWTHQRRRPSHYGIRTHRHKLIYYYGLRRTGRNQDRCWELYDLETDPHERVNRYDEAEYGPVVKRLTRRLNALRKQYGDTADPLA